MTSPGELCTVCGREFRPGGLGRHRGSKTSKCSYTEAERAAMDAHWKAVRNASATQWRRENPEQARANDKLHGVRRMQRTKRRQKNRAWRKANPGYYTSYRQANLQARREAERAWKAAHPDAVREQKRRWVRSRIRSAPVELPAPFIGHELFERARTLVGPTRVWADLLDPLNEDLMSVAVLAMLEGHDPAVAVRQARATEVRWRRSTGPIIGDIRE